MRPVRVLVVDDSPVLRRLVTLALQTAPDIQVVGTAKDGQDALAQVERLSPDLLTMDIEMPVMDGIAAVRELRRRAVTAPIIMFSTLTERGAEATLAALAAGATHYVTKPSGAGSVSAAMTAVRDELVPVVRALVPGPERTAAGSRPAQGRDVSRVTSPPAPRRASTAAVPAQTRPPRPRRRPELLAIGSSTGGPEALATVLSHLPADLPVPVVITQHMPPVFTKQLATRLDRLTPLAVREAVDGEPLRTGSVLLAPGDWHLQLRRAGAGVVAHLTQGPPENFCRPAVDVMLRSAVEHYGGGVLAVVLTGMGSDGRRGCTAVSAAGGRVIAQDRASSVVWGMPGAVVSEGLADEVHPLDGVATAVTTACTRRPEATDATARTEVGTR